MHSTKLQLNLWRELKEAEQAPEQCDLAHLCDEMEEAISATPIAQQLQTAATALLHIAEIFALRAQVLLSNWEQTYSDDGPALEEEDLSELLRQSMSLELDELIAEPEPYVRQSPSHASSGDSFAAPVEKSALLDVFDSEIELMDAETQTTSKAVAVAEAEDVVGWAEAIALWMQHCCNTKAISLVQLQQELGMPMIEVWLGVILSQEQYQLEQREEFYSLNGIWLRQMSK